MSNLYQLHQTLLESFHSQVPDNIPLLRFCQEYLVLAKALNLKKSPKLFDYIFKPNYNLLYKPELNAHLFTAAEYAQTIIQRINEDPNRNYSNELITVVFDYAKLLECVEKVYKIPFGNFAGSRNMKVDSYTSFKVAGSIFWESNEIQRSNTLNGYAIFALRQAIELAGKELIGLENILNEDGSEFNHGTQLPWEFISLKETQEYINFPFNASEIRKIFQWSNQFVHTGRDTMCYVTALALTTVRGLYTRKWIVYFDEPQYANEITDYESLKGAFEEYLNQLEKPKRAKWRHEPTLSVVVG